MADDRRYDPEPFFHNGGLTYEEIKEIRLGLGTTGGIEALIAEMKRELAAGEESKPTPADDEPPPVL